MLGAESLRPQINKEELKIKQELEAALRYKNFVRAELLARQLKKPDHEIKELQKKGTPSIYCGVPQCRRSISFGSRI